ncbi:HlyD family type I secretion periplasmic adaptor subunit [Stappia sp. GBMRC 2046]|uniref:Membrane fusion protein (MFP) family protein n=1 Tax=Stappia sediminis TaxID=2692190 RepID=A0A7X3LWT6_9HYPH|nr:HlyD family type I secretion periplasmic adaptor subunit [Stappia sediminis]MXN66501.1 HlyD family type I secretion periplasmic adaptor subunit [Stappia sediminis]
MGEAKDQGRVITGSLRRHALAGAIMIAVLFGGLGGWAAIAKIGGAVIASGTIVVETNTKRVQHQEGGIVGEIAVREGDAVDAGDLLVRLDDTVVEANLVVVRKQLTELRAQDARLAGERDGQEAIAFPNDLVSREAEPDVALVLSGQRALAEARKASLDGRIDQLEDQIAQFDKQIDGLDAQRLAKQEEIALIDEELKGLMQLREKGLVPETRVTALRRDRARLEGERGGLIAEIARAGEAIGERRLQIIGLGDTFRQSVLEELQEVRSELARLEEQKIAAEDRMRRVDIRAPRSGYVHQLAVHTVGGVVGPGEVLMQIVPKEDLLVIEAQVAPTDIDLLYPGQAASVRLPSFDQRTTPELTARIVTLSADHAVDEATRLSFYTARLAIDPAELAKLGDNRLVPGMPVETFIATKERTVLSYLVKPLLDQVAHAFREE